MSNSDFAARAIALDGLSRLASSEEAHGGMLVGYRAKSAQAVGRKVAERLDDMISVRDFGAVGDGVTDDTDAIRNAIRALRTRCGLFSGYRMGTGCVYFPEGVYRITQNGVLSDDSSTLRQGLILRGAGKNNSILWLDPSALSGEAWFYDNGATNRLNGMVCEHLGFHGGDTWQPANQSTGSAYGYGNIDANCNGFRVSGPDWENNFVFNNCKFQFLQTVFMPSGSNNADTHVFNSCHVAKCVYVTCIDNPQSFNVTWFGCYIDQIYGDVLKFTANAAGGGGNFLMQGGAVIVSQNAPASAHYVVNSRLGGPSTANAPITFSDVRFELRGNYANIADVAGAEKLVNFRGCSFLFNYHTADKRVLTVAGYSSVIFKTCSFKNEGSGRIEYRIGETADGRRGKNAWLAFLDGCIISHYLVFGTPTVSFGTYGGRLTIDETCIAAEKLLDTSGSPNVFSYACDTFNGGLAISTTHRTTKQYTVNPFKGTSQPTGADGLGGRSVQVPPYSRIMGAWIKIEVGEGNSSSIRCRIGNDDKSVVYGSTAVGAQNAGQYLWLGPDVLNIPVGTDANKQGIRFWFDNGSGGNSSASSSGRVDGGVIYE